MRRAKFSGKTALGLPHFKLKLEFFAPDERAQIKFPEFARETKRGPALIKVDDELKTESPPQIRQRDVCAKWSQPDFCVEGKELTIIDEAIKGIAVEVIAMRGVSRPVRICVMRRDDGDARAGFRNAMQLCN